MQTIGPSRRKSSTPTGNSHHGTMTMMMMIENYHDDDDGETKLAYTACLDALKTLMEFLRKEMGIQLQLRPDEKDLLRILQRAHDYILMYLDHDYNNDNENNLTCSILLLSCWKSVYKYTAVSHGRSWRNLQHFKHFMTLHNNNNHNHHNHHEDSAIIEQALQTTIRYAEDCSTCQRQVFLLQRKCRQLPQQL